MHELIKSGLIVLLATVLMSRATAEPVPGAPRLFDITLEPGAALQASQGPDFTVYRIKWGSTAVLSIYEGCCPQEFDAGSKEEDAMINGLTARVATREANGQRSKEWHIRIPLGETGTWVLHAWYRDLSAKDAEAADRMVGSIRAKKAVAAGQPGTSRKGALGDPALTPAIIEALEDRIVMPGREPLSSFVRYYKLAPLKEEGDALYIFGEFERTHPGKGYWTIVPPDWRPAWTDGGCSRLSVSVAFDTLKIDGPLCNFG